MKQFWSVWQIVSSAASYPPISIHRHINLCPSDWFHYFQENFITVFVLISVFTIYLLQICYGPSVWGLTMMEFLARKDNWSFVDEPRETAENQLRILEWLCPCVYSRSHMACQACGLTCKQMGNPHGIYISRADLKPWICRFQPDTILGLSREKKQAILPPWWFLLQCLRYHRAEANRTFSSIFFLNLIQT